MTAAAAAAPLYPANLQIPVDLFASKKCRCFFGCRGDLSFTDHSGNLVFAVHSRFSNPALPANKKLLLDSAGNAIISVSRHKNGSWQGYKVDHGGEELIFRVEGKLNKFMMSELKVFLIGENLENSNSSFKLKGCQFQRSCTIYRGSSIVAQSSLMYKLRKIMVSRCKFRVTLFPGFIDYALVVALIVIFV